MKRINYKYANNVNYKQNSKIVQKLENLIQKEVLDKPFKKKNITTFYVTSNNMESKIFNGDTVLVDKSCKVLNEKDIFMFHPINDDLVIARCKVYTNCIVLIFENSMCSNIEYQLDEISLLGKIII